MDDRLEAGYRELKIQERHAVKMGGSSGTTWGDITKESEEMQIEALKNLREQRKCMAKRISFPDDHVDEDNAPSLM